MPRKQPGAPVAETSASTATATAQPEPQAAQEELLPADAAMWAIVLAGGIGSRFWPLSTPERPKPVLSLLGERPLIAQTVARLAPLVPADRVLVLTSRDIEAAVKAAIPEVPPGNVLVEARPLGTAAALAWGAQEISRRAGPRTVCCVIHSDLAVGFPDMFRQTLRQAGALAAKDSAIVMIGARPTRPETAFGYALPAIDFSGNGDDATWAREFVEKPAPLLAEELIEEGAVWHTGIVTAEARVLLEGLEKHAHEISKGLEALEMGDSDRFAGMIRSVSIERGLLERTDRLRILTADFGWDDVGTWACLRRARDLDDHGNGVLGKVHCVDSTSNVVHGESGTVVLYGVSKMLVVTLDGLTFVTPIERANDLKPLLDALPGSMRLRPVQPERRRASD